jgi:hypothetical protein
MASVNTCHIPEKDGLWCICNFDPLHLARFHRKKFRRPRKSRNIRSIRIAIVVCRPLGEQCEDLTDLSATNFSESPELPARLCRDLLEQAPTGILWEDWNLLCWYFRSLWKQKIWRVTDWTAIVCSHQRLSDELFNKTPAVPGIATFLLLRLLKFLTSYEGTIVFVVITTLKRSGPWYLCAVIVNIWQERRCVGQTPVLFSFRNIPDELWFLWREKLLTMPANHAGMTESDYNTR